MTPGKPIKRFDPLIGYPMLVRFGNIADPTSIEQVDPRNLVGSFGLGVQLRRITLAVTDEDVTVGIGKSLRWLTSLRGNQLPKKSPKSIGSPFGLQGMDFSTEAC